MKALLVIEMPNACEDCSLNIDDLCAGTREPIHSIGCPLKPMPTELEWCSANGDFDEQKYVEGWNACIEEIEK